MQTIIPVLLVLLGPEIWDSFLVEVNIHQCPYFEGCLAISHRNIRLERFIPLQGPVLIVRFGPMGAQFAWKAALSLTERIATASNRHSNTGPSTPWCMKHIMSASSGKMQTFMYAFVHIKYLVSKVAYIRQLWCYFWPAFSYTTWWKRNIWGSGLGKPVSHSVIMRCMAIF